jgi:hypothetical protein
MSKRELRMTASVSLLRPEVLWPEELEAIGRALDMIMLVIPEELHENRNEMREAIAKHMLARGSRDGINTLDLYLECLRWLRWEERLAI